MSGYCGEDLLNVFKDLNIALRSLSPNIIKAWFDTDDKDVKNILNWMCTSLSKENYVSPLEIEEFTALEAPLSGQQYEQETKRFEEKYPSIFDIEASELEIGLLEDEIELALEEEQYLEELIRINENLDNNLSRELATESSEEIKSGLELKSAEELCLSLGNQLDEANKKLHMQLEKYGSNLYNFEFSAVPNFINNIDIKEYQESFFNVNSFLSPILEGESSTLNLTRSLFGAKSETQLDSTLINESGTDALNRIKNRLIHSHQNYIVTKIELEKAKEILDYLKTTDIDSILSLTENPFTQMAREGKEETKRRLCVMLDNICIKLAEDHISQTKLKQAEQELELQQKKLKNLKEIEGMALKFLSQYLVLGNLYVQERKNIDDSDQYFRKILHYINQDLQNCALRTEKMNKIIQEHKDYSSKNIGERFNVVKTIVKVLATGENVDVYKAFEVVAELKTELDRLESKVFCSDFYEHRNATKDLRNNVAILQSFLVCGPTHRIVIIPRELQQILTKIDEHLKKQRTSLKSAVEICSSSRKVPDKLQNYRRQLWMYFYTDPKRMFSILQEIEDEFKKPKLTCFKSD